MDDVAVLGGGIAGLAAARRLSRSGRSVTVLEANSWVGGRLRTLHVGDTPIDVGGSFVQDFYPHTLEIVRELGLDQTLTNFPLKAGVMRAGKVRPVWPGADLLKGGLLSVPSLMRLAAGTAGSLLPRWNSLDPDDLLAAIRYDDETVQEWSVRVLGKEAADYFIGPLLRGVVHWNARTTSRAVAFTILKASLEHRAAYHLTGGMSSLCDRMSAGMTVRTGTPVASVAMNGDYWDVQVKTDAGLEILEARQVVCAVPADMVCELVPQLNSEQAGFFRGISYSSTAIAVVQTNPGRQASRPSVFFNAQEEPVIEGVTPSYSRSEADGSEFVRISISSEAYIANQELADRDLGEFILSAARRIPYLASWLEGGRIVGVVRWPRALPIFDVGHLTRIRTWEGNGRQFESLAFAGDYLCGPYIEGAVKSGLKAASDLLGEASAHGRSR